MKLGLPRRLCPILAKRVWGTEIGDGTHVDAPLVMGILNVTPDSFSDGGRYVCVEAAVAKAMEMIDEGADIIDVGPESTRPGAGDTTPAEQIARAIPVITAIRAKNDSIPISIDTRLTPVASAAVEAGADMLNDTSALRDDPELVDLVAEADLPVVLMHRRGTPATMQQSGGPAYDNVVSEIHAFLKERLEFAVSRGVKAARIILDPGIGFGKRPEHNLLILRHLDRFVSLGQPVLVGASRKSVIGAVLGIDEPSARLAGSLSCAIVATLAGAAILRVHDVRATVEAVRLCTAIKNAT